MLLSLNKINFEFGARTLLEGASWHIYPQEKIGLIGMNGVGKSTLFKVLVGEFTVSAGTISRSKDLKIAYFHQDLQSDDLEESILEVAMSAYEQALNAQRKLREIEEALQKHPDEKQMMEQADWLHQFETFGGYEMEYTTAEVLEGLGFKTADLSRPFKEFSGGWRMRVLLAKMILQKPDILLLDEPTNHLDITSIEWVERYLNSFKGTVIVISHDRFFLDRLVTKIVEVSNQTLNHYTGNYTQYELEKATREEFQLREYENQQDFIRQQEKFVERFRAKASKATQAQSIIKKLNRMERIDAPESEQRGMDFEFELGTQPGKIITTLKSVSKTYGHLRIFENAEAIINRGDKIALIGPNGMGKSTLLRIIAGTEEIEGVCMPGHNVETSFYAQHQLESLGLENAMLTELSSFGTQRTELELRKLLGCFLFHGDDVFKKIKILSGGEKARIALAKTIIQEGNFLLLDEPTNHLDIKSVGSLIRALNAYKGTYVLVSHDRYFIQQTANKIWEIENGQIKIFDGPYDEWLLHKNDVKKYRKEAIREEAVQPQVSEKTQGQQQSREDRKEYKRLQTRFQKTEQKVQELESSKLQLELDLANPKLYDDKVRFAETEKTYNDVLSSLEQSKKEYEILFEKLLEYE